MGIWNQTISSSTMLKIRQGQESEDREAKMLRENAMLRRKLQTGYHFSKEELMEHDKKVAREARIIAKDDIIKAQNDFMEAKYAEHMKKFEVESEAFWNKAASEFKTGDEKEDFKAWCRVMWSIPIDVLVEKFHWKPITEDCCCDNRQNLVKFLNCCAEELEALTKDEMKDIRTICREIANKHGAELVLTEVDG